MASWYFAYGSNLWIEQMIERTGVIGQGKRRPKVAHLANHRLVFQHLEGGGPAFANILCPGDGVLGVVYRCSPAAMEKLDHYEQGYERQPITVTDHQGEVIHAIAYVMTPTPSVRLGPPDPEYLQRILTGAVQHGLPESYIAAIIAIAQCSIPPNHPDSASGFQG